MTENGLEVEFSKLNLKPDDILVVKVNTLHCSEEQAVERLAAVSNDEFIRYIEEKGNKVIVSYSGIDFEIIRKQKEDKLLAYVETGSLETREKKEEYFEYVRTQLTKTLGEDFVCVPVINGSPKFYVEKGEN